MITGLEEKVLSGFQLSQREAFSLASVRTTDAELHRLFFAAARVREHFRGKRIDLCSITNAKSGACSEDCSYCAQSAKSNAKIPVYPLVSEEAVIEKALEAKEAGVKRFCIVTSGKKAGEKELKAIAATVKKVRQTGLLPCATLGLLDRDELSLLMESGLERYHHNLETSERFFSEVCSTHSYSEKMKTIEAAKSVGLSLCSGGIFGLGESWQDRVEMAFALRDLDVDSIPINFLIAVKGTPMEQREPLHPLEALKVISLYRLILPEKEVRVCGGRRQTLGEFSPMVFMAGADSVLTGNYLTTTGITYEDDIRLIKTCGLEVG
ncbi:MAG TPA: biotin synthase BioB [Thermodesulfovibrionales bacterium]|nr:biotin synthase BioB [Thermodesulfovibrionales bacterium]